MEVIVSGRKTNRTTMLIHLCAEAEARGEVSYIVCETQDQAKRIARKAKELGLVIHFPITFYEFAQNRFFGGFAKNFFIDNADYLLQYLARDVTVAAIVVRKDPQDD